MAVFVGGAELNVATALKNWDINSKYVTAMPDNYLSHEIITSITNKGVDCSSIKKSGNRVGTYYLPQGADLKHAGVIYDRKYSSFADLKPGQLNWNEILKDASWFHFSAISPALDENTAAVCLEALKAARAKGITISVDLNYRAQLWQYGKQPVEVMPELVQYCNIIMGNIWAAEKLLGVTLESRFNQKATNDKHSLLNQARATATNIFNNYLNCHTVANTFRFDEEAGIIYFASLDTATEQIVSSTYRLSSIVDKIGSGDCFMAGLIYGLVEKMRAQEIIDFAAAAAILKLKIKGDATTSTVEDIKQLILDHE